MSATPYPPPRKVNTTYELFIGALSVLSIVNIFLIYLARNEVVDSVIFVVDLFLSVLFFVDFVVRIVSAPVHLQYFLREFGWADLFSSLPIPQIKILRIFAVLRTSRIMRSHGGMRLVQNLISKRAEGTLLTVSFLIFLIAEFGGIGIAYIEGKASGANIRSGADAIWYVFVTITTIGYGDLYPTTEAGRLMGLLIMLAGVGIFAVFTGYIAKWFLTPAVTKVNGTLEPQDPRRQLAEVQAELEMHEKAFAELRKKLNDIEKSL